MTYLTRMAAAMALVRLLKIMPPHLVAMLSALRPLTYHTLLTQSPPHTKGQGIVNSNCMIYIYIYIFDLCFSSQMHKYVLA